MPEYRRSEEPGDLMYEGEGSVVDVSGGMGGRGCFAVVSREGERGVFGA